MKLFEILPEIWVSLGIGLIVGALIILAWFFDFFKKKKISEFFEKIADAIYDFFT